MVKIDVTENDSTNVLINPLIARKNKHLRFTSFTSSASLMLSWSFPLIVLCFQSNKHISFDARFYAALHMAYLLSGFMKRVFLKRVLPPTMLNAISPAVISFISNGIFLSALYKSNWNWMSNLAMFISRLVFGWSTYSAADYIRRAKNEGNLLIGMTPTVEDRVSRMVPDLQDSAFHSGVLISLFLCFILEACLHNFGNQMAEFYSMLVLSVFSAAFSILTGPCIYRTVSDFIVMRKHPVPSSSNVLSSCTDNQAIIIRSKFVVSKIVDAFSTNMYDKVHILVIVSSGIITASTIVSEYLLLPYLIVYLRFDFISSTFFPFLELFVIYASIFISEEGIKLSVLEHSKLFIHLVRISDEKLMVFFVAVSACLSATPALLFMTANCINVSRTLLVFVLILYCLIEGLLNSGHTIFSGLIFDKSANFNRCQIVIETGEHLVGLTRCLLSSIFIIISAAVLYHLGFMAAMITVATAYSIGLSLGLYSLIRVVFKRKSTQPIIEEE